MAKEPNKTDKSGLVNIIRNTSIDGVKIAATSGALAFLGFAKDCSQLPREIGLPLGEFSPVQMATLAFDVGAGAFAGYTKRYAASLGVYAASLIPEVHDLATSGDSTEVGKKILAKTIVYGGSYAMGWLFSGNFQEIYKQKA